jgi:Glycosyl transferases group 1
MTRLGIIARYDEGGLATMTCEAARHLRPDAVLLVRVDPSRGDEDAHRYDGLGVERSIVSFPPHPGQLARWTKFVEEVDVVYTAETMYLRDLTTICKRAKTRLVLHAMPELYDLGSRPSLDVWAPTEWMLGRLPAPAMLMPVPVDRARCAPKPITEVRTMLHVTGEAMLDRNGTDLVKQALALCTVPFTLLIAGNGPTEPITMGVVTVKPVGRVHDYWRLYDDADALVLPRRYGGLSLPMQEAASCELPIVSLHVAPQNRWLYAPIQAPATRARSVRMKGGQVNVWTCEPTYLAQRLDALASCDPEPAVKASRSWAEFLDWELWASVYRKVLGCND